MGRSRSNVLSSSAPWGEPCIWLSLSVSLSRMTRTASSLLKIFTSTPTACEGWARNASYKERPSSLVVSNSTTGANDGPNILFSWMSRKAERFPPTCSCFGPLAVVEGGGVQFVVLSRLLVVYLGLGRTYHEDILRESDLVRSMRGKTSRVG